MCGRYTFASPPETVADHFRLTDLPTLTPRYNVAPGTPVAVVALKSDGERLGLAHLKWGLVPDWSQDPDRGIRPVNARDDSMGNPMFSPLFAAQRCLLPATGFYEWRVAGKRKEPVHFSLTGGGLMAFARLWSVWTDGTRKVPTCCLITTTPNELVRDYHDRMPVRPTPGSSGGRCSTCSPTSCTRTTCPSTSPRPPARPGSSTTPSTAAAGTTTR